MNIQHYKLNLDLLKQSSMPVIYGYQLDNKSRYVDITLTANGAEVTLDSTMTAVLNATTNNVIVAEAQSCNISGNLIEVELTDKVLSLPGAVKCEVVLSDSSGTVITAQHFLVKVTEKAINNKSKFEPGGSALATKDDVATAKSEAISAADALLDEYDEAVTTKINLKADRDSVDSTLASLNKTVSDNKAEADTALDGKADKATTLAGYGIIDAYDKTYLDKALKNKLDKMPFDTVLAENSPNYVTSGTVYGAIDTVNQTIATKYDSSNVEKGSGTLSPATASYAGNEGNFIYSKIGNTVTVTVNMTKFLAGKNYIQMSGLPFRQDLSIKLASQIARSSSGDYVNVRVDGSWLYFSKTGSNFADGETLIVTVTYII